MNTSRRQKLLEFAETGRLRSTLDQSSLDYDVIDLAVDVILRYCEPRRRRKTMLPQKPKR